MNYFEFLNEDVMYIIITKLNIDELINTSKVVEGIKNYNYNYIAFLKYPLVLKDINTVVSIINYDNYIKILRIMNFIKELEINIDFSKLYNPNPLTYNTNMKYLSTGGYDNNLVDRSTKKYDIYNCDNNKYIRLSEEILSIISINSLIDNYDNLLLFNY
jgi:hypothetical protein